VALQGRGRLSQVEMHPSPSRKRYLSLYFRNVLLNTPLSLVLDLRLASGRYLEYVAALDLVGTLNSSDWILDVGCGHSLLPSIISERCGVVALDIAPQSVRWQAKKAQQKRLLEPTWGDAAHLPFADNTFSGVVSISAIEHMPEDLDTLASKEMWRVLRPGGVCVVTTTFSANKYAVQEDWNTHMPLLLSLLGRRFWSRAFKFLPVDRREAYYERIYNRRVLNERLIDPVGWKLETALTFEAPLLVRMLHRFFLPPVIAPLECFLAYTLRPSASLDRGEAVILKLVKSLR